MKQPTLADLYFDDDFINTTGVVQGLMSGAKDGDQSYTFEKHNDGSDSVFYRTDSGLQYFLGVRNPEDIQLAAGPTDVVSDAGGAAFGVYPGMGKRTQKSDIGEKMITGAPDFAAGGVRGFTASSGGILGDMQKLGRFIRAIATDNEGGSIEDKLTRAGAAMEGKTFFPSTEDWNKEGYTIPGTSITIPPLPAAVPAGTSAFGMTPEERQKASEAGQFVGELTGDPFAAYKAGKLAVKGVSKLAETLAPKAAEMARQGVEKMVAPMQTYAVPPDTSAASKAMAPASDIGFYSAVEQAAMNIQRKSGSGQAMLNDITKGENVKADEIKWLGLDEFLKGKKNVTKQEVQDYIAANKVDVQEVTLDNSKTLEREKLKNISQQAFEKVEDVIPNLSPLDRANLTTFWAVEAQRGDRSAIEKIKALNLSEDQMKVVAEYGDAVKRQQDFIESTNGYMAQPRFGQYTLPGGENYREILLTMPDPKQRWWAKNGKGEERVFSDADEASRFAGPSGDARAMDEQTVERMRKQYESPHWDQSNVLAHMRVNDRIDADGKKMLLIEEVQSDWHQAGRDKGYDTPERRAAQQKQLDDIVNERQRLLDEQKRIEDLAKPFTDQGKDAPSNLIDQWNIVSNRLNSLQTEQNRLGRNFGSTGVPDAPMKDTWYQLALKRALKYAADNGYERVGLTTGKLQAERYDLSKQIDSIQFNKMPDGNIFWTAYKDGKRAVGNDSTPSDLASQVGKDLAKKIIEHEGPGKFSGIDLQVGGEGMKKYYDEMYPKFLEKYGKKWGASVGETSIDAGGKEPIRYIDITPEMRESVKKGQPLFTAAPLTIPAASETIQDRERK